MWYEKMLLYTRSRYEKMYYNIWMWYEKMYFANRGEKSEAICNGETEGLERKAE